MRRSKFQDYSPRIRQVELSDFDYDLPQDRIAQVPVEPRDHARLLVDQGRLQGHASIAHRQVFNLPEYLQVGDLLVVNDTRVIPGRLRLNRSSGGSVEILLLDPLSSDSRRWSALVKPGGKLKDGEVLRHLETGSECIHRRGVQGFGVATLYDLSLIHQENPVVFGFYRRVAFAGPCFQAGAVGDGDVAAAVFDHALALQFAGGFGNAFAAYAEHVGNQLLGHFQLVAR